MGLSSYLKLGAGFVVALLIAAMLYAVYHHGVTTAQTAGDLKLATYKASDAQADAKATRDAFGRYANDVTRFQGIEAGYLKTQSNNAATTAALSEHIDEVSIPDLDVVDVHPRIRTDRQPRKPGVAVAAGNRSTPSNASGNGDPASSVADRASVCDRGFSTGFVRLWNAAAGTDVRTGSTAVQGHDSTSVDDFTGPNAAACSGVSQADVLGWFIDYANRTHNVEAKLTAVAATQASDAATAASAAAAQ